MAVLQKLICLYSRSKNGSWSGVCSTCTMKDTEGEVICWYLTLVCRTALSIRSRGPLNWSVCVISLAWGRHNRQQVHQVPGNSRRNGFPPQMKRSVLSFKCPCVCIKHLDLSLLQLLRHRLLPNQLTCLKGQFICYKYPWSNSLLSQCGINKRSQNFWFNEYWCVPLATADICGQHGRWSRIMLGFIHCANN